MRASLITGANQLIQFRESAVMLVEQSICYLVLAGAVYLAAVENKRLESLGRILMCGSACSLHAWQLFS